MLVHTNQIRGASKALENLVKKMQNQLRNCKDNPYQICLTTRLSFALFLNDYYPYYQCKTVVNERCGYEFKNRSNKLPNKVLSGA